MLFCAYKQLGQTYNVNEILILIKERWKHQYLDDEINYHLYLLLEDTSYLEIAHNQVRGKTSSMEDGAKFLNYPIPKAIVEEYNKVFK